MNLHSETNDHSNKHEDAETVRVMHPHDADMIPAPTGAPIVFAFGTTLLFAGLVTNAWVAIVGLICAIIGILGWWFQVLPRESMEAIPADAAREIDTGPEIGAPLPDEAQHAQPRQVLPVEIPRIRSGIYGGLGGGIAMAVVALLWGLINHSSIWFPINLLAAMVLSSFDTASAESLASFSAAGFFAGLGIHLAFSTMIGLVLASLMPMASRWPRLFACVVAPFVWSLLLYVSMGVLDPTLEKWVNWWWFFGSQFAFGIAAGFIIASTEKIQTVQFLSPAERMALERSKPHGQGGNS